MDASILPCELVVGAPFPAMSCSLLFALNTVLSLAGLFHTQAGFASRDQPAFSSFVSTFYFYLYQQDPPLALSPVFFIFNLSIFTRCLTSLSLLSCTTSLELVLQLSCPPHTFWMCPLSYCDVAIAGTGEAMPHSSAALVGCESAPSLLRCDLSPGPSVGE